MRVLILDFAVWVDLPSIWDMRFGVSLEHPKYPKFGVTFKVDLG